MSTEDGHNKMGEIVAKCWKDAAFKKRFVSDPSSVLREHQIEVPAGVQLKVVENTDKVVYFTLPEAPGAAALSDSELEKAAGGAAERLARGSFVGGMVTDLNYQGPGPTGLGFHHTKIHVNTCGNNCSPG